MSGRVPYGGTHGCAANAPSRPRSGTVGAPLRIRVGTAATWISRVAVLASLAIAGGYLTYVVNGAGSLTWRVTRAIVASVVVAVLMYLTVRRPRMAILPIALAGLLSMSIGYAYGIDAARHQGMSWSTAIGDVVCVCGLLLIVWSGCMVIALSRGTPMLIPASALAVLVALAVVNVAIGPVAEGVELASAPRLELDDATPGDYGLEYEVVSFPADDGVQLAGWYLPSSNGAAVAVVHGAASTRSAALRHAVTVARNGYGVLLFDSRGHGESGGRAMDLGWHGDADIRGAISFLASSPDVDHDRIAVVGLSLGGEEAIGEAATDPRVRAVVAEGASYRVMGDWPPRYGTGVLGRFGDWVMFQTVALVSDAEAPATLEQSVSALEGPRVLMIQSGDGTEITAGRSLRALAPEVVELWELPDVGHLGALSADPDEWERRVVAFLDRNTRPMT